MNGRKRAGFPEWEKVNEWLKKEVLAGYPKAKCGKEPVLSLFVWSLFSRSKEFFFSNEVGESIALECISPLFKESPKEGGTKVRVKQYSEKYFIYLFTFGLCIVIKLKKKEKYHEFES